MSQNPSAATADAAAGGPTAATPATAPTSADGGPTASAAPKPDARINLGDAAEATARIEVIGTDGAPIGSLTLTLAWSPPSAHGRTDEGRGDDAPPHPEPTGDQPTAIDPSIDITDRIRRGISRAGLSPTEEKELYERHKGDETAVLRELVDIVRKLEAEAGEGAGEPTDEPPDNGKKAAQPENAVKLLKREERQTVIDTLRKAGIADEDVKTVIQDRLKTDALASLELGRLSAAARKIGYTPSATLSRAGWAASILQELVADQKKTAAAAAADTATDTAAEAAPGADEKPAPDPNASYNRSIPKKLARLKTLDPEAAKATNWRAEAAKNPRATLAALDKAIKAAETRNARRTAAARRGSPK